MVKTKSVMMFWVTCPRCGKRGKLKVQRVNPNNPTWYGYTLHFENDGFPHGKIVKTCYIGKVVGNQLKDNFSQEIINLPNFKEDVSLISEIYERKGGMRVGVIEVWCDAPDCEHCEGSLCQSDTIEIRRCYTFSRRKDWRAVLDANTKSA